ncbi:MAG: hypothetical protein US76_04110 [Parcubacteria group bacterium GW2011_GWA2_38_13b]|nr:MAG: hypothetical protein US76_04110 [Parcubacteria group bacterium GW2011_GWA2_38_13b]
MLIPLVKINITADKDSKEKILDFLQEKGVMEISEVKIDFSASVEKKEQDFVYDTKRLKAAFNFLLPYDKIKKGLKEKMETMFNPSIVLSKRELENIIQGSGWQKTVETVLGFQEKINQDESTIDDAQGKLKLLYGWENLNFAPQDATSLKNHKILLGILPSSIFINLKSKKNFYKKVKKVAGKIFFLRTVSDASRERKIIVIFPAVYEKSMREVFSVFNFREADLPYSDKISKDSIKELEEKMEKSRQNILDYRQILELIAKDELKNIYAAMDYIAWQTEKEANREKISATHYLFSLDGWIEEKNINALEKAIAEITPHFAVSQLKISAREQQPVIIKNKFFEPYEVVTDIYGLPLPNEPDPTPFLAPFFTIFFAFALTDAGYGIVLLTLCWFMIKFLKIPKEKQKLFKVLMLGSIATIIMGALFGGWFGVVPKDFPDSFGALKNFFVKIQVIDPMANPMGVMFLAFIMGIIQIWFGIFVAVWWHFKKGDWKKALMDYAVWDFLLAGIMFWLVADKLALLPSMAVIARYILFAGLGAIVLTQGRAKKNILLKFGIGVISLYGLVSYLGDVLSYSRLLALGLATGIIAMVINLIAMIFKDMAPFGWMGWIVAGLVLVGGHLFNIVINVLGAFIHSGRLQYVEFFPKFMEGGGRRFKPFTRKNNYIRIIS